MPSATSRAGSPGSTFNRRFELAQRQLKLGGAARDGGAGLRCGCCVVALDCRAHANNDEAGHEELINARFMGADPLSGRIQQPQLQA